MKKSNLVLRAAVASALFVVGAAASAGTLSTATSGGTKFAVENFGTGTTAATSITPGALTYTIGTTNGIVINAGGTIYLTVRLANGKFLSTGPTGAVTGTALAVGGAGNGVVGAVVLSTDGTTAMWPIAYTASATLGVGSTFLYTPAAGDVVGVNTTLATVGNAVTASVSLSAITPTIVAPSTTTAPNTGTSQAADIDAPIATGNIAVATQAFSGAVSALTGANPVAGSKVQIDLTASPVATKYVITAAAGTTTAATVAALGSVTFTDSSTVTYQLNGTTAYNVAAALTGAGTSDVTITVTPGAGEAFPVGATVFDDVTSAACTTADVSSAALTATTASAAVTLAAVTQQASGGAYWICVGKPSGTGNTATPVTPTISAVATSAVANTKTTTASGTGYALGYNGSQVDVRNYVPAAVTGWTTIVRVINTGTVTADISGAVVDESTGVAGTSGTLVTGLKAGGAATLNSTQIETALGAVGVDARPRIRITAPTNGLDVQTYVFNPNGNFSIIHGKE